MKRIIVRVGFGLSIAMVLLAIGAFALGLDTDPDWGPTRHLLLIFGAVGVLIFADPVINVLRVALSPLVRRLPGGWLANLRHRMGPVFEPIGRILARRPLPLIGRLMPPYAALLLVLAAQFWLASAGTWSDLPSTSSYYDLLAQSFLDGQIHLPIDPDPRLLELEDPYLFDARSSIRHLWDVSLYDGRFYLYWGPVPALLISPLRGLAGLQVGDHLLTTASVLVSSLFAFGLVRRLRGAFFPDLSSFWEGVAILAVGLGSPLPWLLSRPEVYEASIAVGQAFNLAALWLALNILLRGRPPGRLQLAATGLFVALSAGSRTSLAPAGAVPILTALAGSYRGHRAALRRWRATIRDGLALLAPLALGALAYGWYNWLRFDRILEFGHRYQLTGMNLRAIYDQVISIQNLPPNLYNYFLNPPHFLTIFPYLKPRWGGHYVWPLVPPTPAEHYSEQVAGLLYSSPLLLFLVVAPAMIWVRLRGEAADHQRETQVDRSAVLALLLGSALLGLTPALLYIVSTMRYAADFTPTLLLASVFCGWQALEWGRRHGRFAAFRLAVVLAAACLATAAAGLLLGITGYAARMEHLNPELFRRLTEILPP